MSASAPFSHAWTPEKKLLILIFLQCDSFPILIIKLISCLLSIGDYGSFSSAVAILFTLGTQKSSSGTQKFIELWTDIKKNRCRNSAPVQSKGTKTIYNNSIRIITYYCHKWLIYWLKNKNGCLYLLLYPIKKISKLNIIILYYIIN